MMVNPNNFQAILLNKSKSTYVKATMNIGNEKIESLSAVKFLAIEIDDKLNFNDHINTRFYGPKIWNSLPYHIKSAENLLCFKNLIKSWNGSFCSCKVCRK